MKNRALRRHHKARKRAYALRVFRFTYGRNSASWAATAAVYRAENMQVCSTCCGNCRNYEGPTLQERRFLSTTT